MLRFKKNSPNVAPGLLRPVNFEQFHMIVQKFTSTYEIKSRTIKIINVKS